MVKKQSVDFETLRAVTLDLAFSPNGDVEKKLTAQLQANKKTLDLAMYSFTNTRLEQVIEARAKAGVTTRIIFDKGCTTGSQAKIHDRLAKTPNITVRLCNPIGYIMHDKYGIHDGQAVTTGSYNWTFSAQIGNFENEIITDDPDAVLAYQQNFETVWGKSKSEARTLRGVRRFFRRFTVTRL